MMHEYTANAPGQVAKPLLRGWLHAGAALIALGFTAVLGWRSWSDWPRLISLLVFGASMVELYTMSAIYHIGHWRPQVLRRLRALDHANIFVLIAGTYTPLCYNLLDGWLRWVILVSIWTLAVAGVTATSIFPQMPRWVGTSLYISMGWVAVLALPGFWQALPAAALGLLATGGALYTLGAVIYGRKRPNPFPRVFGFHELFHLCTIGAGVIFALVVWFWVVPLIGR
jgi:hemolysin III